MNVAKKLVLTASSPSSFQDALEQGLLRASETLRGITELEFLKQKAILKNGKITDYRIEFEVTFVLED